MGGLLFILILFAGLFSVGSYFARRGGMHVRDSSGHTISIGPPAGLSRMLGINGIFVDIKSRVSPELLREDICYWSL